jgi:hypothetical protein
LDRIHLILLILPLHLIILNPTPHLIILILTPLISKSLLSPLGAEKKEQTGKEGSVTLSARRLQSQGTVTRRRMRGWRRWRKCLAAFP